MTSDNQEEQSNEIKQIATPDGQLTERELQAVQLRYLGKSSREIAAVTGWNESHVRRLFMRGGRLEGAYEVYVQRQQSLTQNQADNVLLRARDEAQSAIERMIQLSKDASNGPVAFKANEYLLTISGILNKNNLQGFLESKTYDQAIKMVEETFQEIFGRGFTNDPIMAVYSWCPRCNKSIHDVYKETGVEKKADHELSRNPTNEF